MTQAHIDGAKARIPMGRFLTIPEIAAEVAFIASRECSFTTGAVFDISGGRARPRRHDQLAWAAKSRPRQVASP